MKQSILFLSFLFSFFMGFTNPQPADWTTCPEPENVHKTAQTYSTVSFDWDDCECIPTEYRVFYVVNGNASQEFATTSSDFNFTGLSAGTYDFYFYAVCGTQQSASIIIEDVVCQ